MQTTHAGTSKAAIFGRVLEAECAAMSPAAAQAILELGFAKADKARMSLLSAKAKAGTLTAAEQDEINSYETVGHMLAALKSKARQSLNSNGNGIQNQ